MLTAIPRNQCMPSDQAYAMYWVQHRYSARMLCAYRIDSTNHHCHSMFACMHYRHYLGVDCNLLAVCIALLDCALVHFWCAFCWNLLVFQDPLLD